MTNTTTTPASAVNASTIIAETDIDLLAKEACLAFPLGGPVALGRIDSGLINRTYEVKGAAGRWILQWVNPIFGPEVHDDIEAITRHLERLLHAVEEGFHASLGARVARVAVCLDDGEWLALHDVAEEVKGEAVRPAGVVRAPDARNPG